MKIFFITLILLGLSACAINPSLQLETAKDDDELDNQLLQEQDIDDDKVESINLPQLRLNTEMHTAAIRKMSIDAQQRFVVTGSWDKTARVWDLQTGKLLKVLRIPIGEDHEGKIYTVAISPDGETIAVGGYTKAGHTDKGNYSIYLFKRNGELINRLSGLPSIISHLTYSPDGQFLVACLGRKKGIRIYQHNQLIVEDKNYGAISYWADFDAQGRLVTSSYDGKIRLYDKNFQLIQSINPSGGKQPFSVRFNPNGDKIAVSFANSKRVQVLSGTDLNLLYNVDTQGISNGNLERVAWSMDGQTLLAGGKNRTEDGDYPIFSWSQEGQGQRSQWVAAQNTIVGIQALPNGNIVVAATDPFLGVFDAQGNLLYQPQHDTVDFRGSNIFVSIKGDSFQFDYVRKGKKFAQFDLKYRELSWLPDDEISLNKPRTKGLNITDWKGKRNPKLNGKPLLKGVVSRSLAITNDNSGFVLGREWDLRFFNQNGKQRWKKITPAAAWAVNIPENDKTVIAAFGDGTIRWYRLEDGEELLAFFPHNDGRRWILWTPSGYYAASVGAEELIGWHVNKGSDHAAHFFHVGQFRDHFHRPDIISLILEELDEEQAIEKANEKAGIQSDIRTRGAEGSLPPVVQILSPQDKTSFDSNQIKLRFKIDSKESVVGFTVYWDGRPQESYPLSKDSLSREIEHSIPIPLRNVTVGISVKNEKGQTSNPDGARVNLVWSGSVETNKPRLHLLAIGVNKLNKEQGLKELLFPSDDAKQFVNFFEEQTQLYQIDIPKLLSQNPTKEEIMSALDDFTRSADKNPEDIYMVFFAGHGEADKKGMYHFIPSDFVRDRISSTAISSTELMGYFDKIKGKLLVFLDTCVAGRIGERSRGIGGEYTKVINELISAEKGVVVFAASGKEQLSEEHDALKGGVFTTALLEALRGATVEGKTADANHDKEIDINEIKAFVDNRVRKLTNEKQTPVIIAPQGVSNYPIAIVK